MEKLTPAILLDDKNFLVVDKPAGMIVNNADTARDVYTLQDFILEGNFIHVENHDSEFAQRSGIVHRLDKETSGVLIIAKTKESFTYIQNQFKEKNVHKVYQALVHGSVVEEGEINVPIGRLPWNRMRFGVIPQGRESFTKFGVLKHLRLKNGNRVEELSLIEVYPQTGRTHQIRVHMQYAGHPLFSDSLYAGRKQIAKDKKYLNRHFLHASVIEFKSPTTHEMVRVEAPLPPELVDFLDYLS